MVPQGHAAVQPAGTSQAQRYQVDEITEPTLAILQVTWGRTRRKKDVAQGLVQPPDPEARYNRQPIPPEYALVHVLWMADKHERDELDYPTEEGAATIGRALGSHVLWNKVDIVLLMENPASKSSQPSPSPPSSPSDDDNASGLGSSP